MAIFNSYVSLPEGNSAVKIGGVIPTVFCLEDSPDDFSSGDHLPSIWLWHSQGEHHHAINR